MGRRHNRIKDGLFNEITFHSGEKKLKKSILISVSILLITANAFALEYYILGINTKLFKDRNWFELAAGAATAIVVHEAAHIAAAELQGHDWHFSMESTGPAVWFENGDNYFLDANAGFFAETIVGTTLNLIPSTRGTDFAKGYNCSTFTRLLSYNLRWDYESGVQGDFKMIDENGGDGEAEHFIYTGIAKLNFAYSLRGGPVLNENRFIGNIPDLNFADADDAFFPEF
jgi:hypothetical protein